MACVKKSSPNIRDLGIDLTISNLNDRLCCPILNFMVTLPIRVNRVPVTPLSILLLGPLWVIYLGGILSSNCLDISEMSAPVSISP